MQTEEKQMKMSYLIKRFVPYFKKYKWILILDLICASLTTVCELVFPMLVRYITNMGINNIAGLTVGIILKIGLFYLILRIIDSAANFYMADTGHIMGAKIETDMRRDLFAHLETLSHSYFAEHKVGQIMARITSDLFDITEFAHHCPEEFFIAALKIIVSFIILCGVNVPLTVIVFASLPLIFCFVKFFNTRMRKAFKKQRNQIGEINSQVEDTLLGIRVVKSFATEKLEAEKFEDGNKKFLDTKKLGYFYMAGFQTSNRAFEGVMYLIVVVAGALFMINGKISPADLTAYLLYVSTLLATLRTIIQFTEQFQRGMTGIERFLEIMDAPAEITEKENADELKNVQGNITFENVGFHYSDDDTDVLSNINLNIKKGDSVALVGPSGGGKTTISRLAVRFWDADKGKITVGGMDISKIDPETLMSLYSIVFQDVTLFNNTVIENIRIGKMDATDEEVIAAAKLAHCDEFAEKLSDGWNTMIGENGCELSGGERQRISIARAFLKDAPVILLDEATASLDVDNETMIQESLSQLIKNKTVMIIAHRMRTVADADKIVVLKDGKVAESGKPSELMAKSGIYAGMVNTQLTAANWSL